MSSSEGSFINYTFVEESLSSNPNIRGSAPRWFLPATLVRMNRPGELRNEYDSLISNLSITLVVIDSERENVGLYDSK